MVSGQAILAIMVMVVVQKTLIWETGHMRIPSPLNWLNGN